MKEKHVEKIAEFFTMLIFGGTIVSGILLLTIDSTFRFFGIISGFLLVNLMQSLLVKDRDLEKLKSLIGELLGERLALEVKLKKFEDQEVKKKVRRTKRKVDKIKK